MKLFRIALLFFVITLVSACDNNDGGISGTGQGDNSYQISGTAQKGPFLIGSTVDVSRLDDKGLAIEGSLTTETTDSLGSFSFEMDKAGAVQIKVDGYHYNELTGVLSDDKLILNAIANVADDSEAESQTINVNMLTHLTAVRIKELMKQGLSVDAATDQSQKEWLEAFKTLAAAENVFKFSVLNLYQEDEVLVASNNYLLFISSVFYQYSSKGGSASLIEVLNQTANDFGDNGKIDENPTLINELQIHATQLNAGLIQGNLEALSLQVSGATKIAADISSFLKQLIITSPAEDSLINKPVKVNVAGLSKGQGIEYSLLIDGENVLELADDEDGFLWQPYFWSAEADSRHTLIVEAKLDGKAIYSNLVNVTVDNVVNSQLVLVYPINDVVIRNTLSPILTWEALDGAANYQVQIFALNDQVNLIYDTVTEATQVASSDLLKNSYVWRMRAANHQGLFGTWTDYVGFSIDGPLSPSGESLGAIITKGNDASYTLNLSWGSVANASQYIVEVAADETFNTIVESFKIDATTTTYNTEMGKYYWRVAAVDENAIIGDWSEIQAIEAGVFKRQFGGSGNDSPQQVISTKDGGAIILAHTQSKGDSQFDDWIIKLDANGNTDWEYVLKKTGSARLWDLREFSDGSIYAMGASGNWGDQKGYLIKLSGHTPSDSRLVWETEYRTTGADSEDFRSLTELDGKLYVVGGERECGESTRCPTSHYKLYEFNASTGELITFIELPNPTGALLDGVSYLSTTSNDNLLLACSAKLEGADESLPLGAACILNFSINGTLIWSWDSTNSVEFGNGRFATETPWGGFVVLGQGGYYNDGLPLAIFDASGEVQGTYTAQGAYSNKRETIVFDNENNMLRLVSGYSSDYPELWSTTPDGLTEVVKIYRELKYDYSQPASLARTTDGGLLTVFSEYQSGYSNSDIIIMKTNMNGNM